MSAVDTRFSEPERAALLSEVENHLPAFLSTDAVERPDPVGDVTDLLGLQKGDLDRVIAVHVALTDEVRAFVSSLKEGLRNPLTSSIRPRVVSQAVRGGIDWGATVRHRAGAGAASLEFVIRPARRVFDTPENRALAFVLEQLDLALRRILPAESDERSGVYDKGWYGEIVATAALLRAARRHHWLRDVPAEQPDRLALKRLRAARTSFYKERIPAVLELLARFTRDPSPEDITALLTKRYFEPQRDWLLFELVLALRIARTFAARSATKRKTRLLIGTGRSPYARYVMPDGAEVRLWYQAWPTDAGASVHIDARGRYSISAGSSRPDFIIQLRRAGSSTDSVLLEAKATRSGSYLGAGLLQMLGYLKDRPALFTTQPSAWLVAPSSTAFATADAEGTELWAIDSSAVAEALASRFGYHPA